MIPWYRIPTRRPDIPTLVYSRRYVVSIVTVRFVDCLNNDAPSLENTRKIQAPFAVKIARGRIATDHPRTRFPERADFTPLGAGSEPIVKALCTDRPTVARVFTGSSSEQISHCSACDSRVTCPERREDVLFFSSKKWINNKIRLVSSDTLASASSGRRNRSGNAQSARLNA